MSETSEAAHGPAYTRDGSFRARMEAHQRRFRAEVLRAGFAKYGHVLDDAAARKGANFLHPDALTAASARIAYGKGVDRARTFGNMLASQAMCFNVFGPLGASEQGRSLAAAVLRSFLPSVQGVRSIAIEHTPAPDVFGDQSGVTGVDADLLFELEEAGGVRSVLVVETKLVETSFSTCGHRKQTPPACPTDVRLGDDGSGCRYGTKNGFRYWPRTLEHGTLDPSVLRLPGCPFGGPLWQLWVNHTLAHEEARRRGAQRARYAVCAPAENEALGGGAVLAQFRALVRDPSSVVFLPLEAVLRELVCVTTDADESWRRWARALEMRYVVPPKSASPSPGGSVATSGHRKVVTWMGTPAFRELVATFKEATGSPSSVYFRPTDGGVVMLGLDPQARSYVGLRTHAADDAYRIAPSGALPTREEAAARWRAHSDWVRTLKSTKEEERGAMAWLRRALGDCLRLPELGEGWTFLHQEWRFRAEDGGGKKSDILAVHAPTGRLGIVELKDAEHKLTEARAQVKTYADFWRRDAAVLAPLFTELLRAQGAAYGNEAAEAASVAVDDAVCFVGVASSKGLRVERVS